MSLVEDASGLGFEAEVLVGSLLLSLLLIPAVLKRELPTGTNTKETNMKEKHLNNYAEKSNNRKNRALTKLYELVTAVGTGVTGSLLASLSQRT